MIRSRCAQHGSHTQPELLATRLKETEESLLLWLCWGIERVRANELDQPPFDEWQKFADTILEAVQLNSVAMLPQLAMIIARDNQELRGPSTWEFLGERCAALFGDVTRVLDCFLDPPEKLSSLPVISALKSAAETANQEMAVATRISSSMSAEQTIAIEEAEDLVSSGKPITDKVPQALAKVAIGKSVPTEKRKRAISILRAGKLAGLITEPILAEWFSSEVDEDMGSAFASAFYDDPESLDGLLQALNDVAVPTDESSTAVKMVRYALDAVIRQLKYRPSQVGTDRAQRCVAAARRFTPCQSLQSQIQELHNLAS